MPVSPRRPASRSLRRWSMSGRVAKRNAIWVPPAKSMPNRTPFTAMARKPTRIRAQEAPMAHHFQRRKSMLVCRKSSIAASDRKGGDVLPPPVLELEERVRHEDAGEDRDQETDDQRDGEPLDGPGPELEEEDRRDDDGDVRVDDRRDGLGEYVLDRRRRRAPAAQLLTDALEDEDVRVHGHADRQDEARDPRQGQRRVEKRHRSEQQDSVQDERQHGVPSRPPVVGDDRDEDEQHAGDGRCDPLADGIEPEGGAERRSLGESV